jgi:hypothetical protein
MIDIPVELEKILTKMVENTEIIITNDLPSLLGLEDTTRLRRVHKDQILKNLPETAQAIQSLLLASIPEKMKETWYNKDLITKEQAIKEATIRGFNQGIDAIKVKIGGGDV